MRGWWLLAAGCPVEPAGDRPPTSIDPTAPVVDPQPHGPPMVWASPPAGIYAGEVTVTLRADDPDARLTYTLDGTPAGPGSTRYDGPIHLEDAATVRIHADNAHGRSAIAPTYLMVAPDLAAPMASTLPVVVLWTPLDAPDDKEESFTPFSLSVFEPPAGAAVQWPGPATLSTRAGLKVRGSSSSDYPKHPYRLELWDADDDGSRDLPLLGMPADDDWVLVAPLKFDRAFVRDALVYELSNALGRWAPRTRYAEVYVADGDENIGDDDYVGIYVITERIERGPDRVDIAGLDLDDLTLPDLSGGYLFKEDREGPDEVGFVAGTAGGAITFDHPFVWIDPAEAEVVPAQSAYLTGALDALADSLLAGQLDPARIDVPAWIDHHLLNVWAKNPDAFRLSGYYHKDRDGAFVAGPVWDFDRTMGCAAEERCDDPTGWDAVGETDEDATAVFDYGFWGPLFDDPTFRDAYFARLAALLDGELATDRVNARIDALTAPLTHAAARNFAVWTDYPPRGGDLADEVAIVKSWLAARHDWLAGCLALPDPRQCPRAGRSRLR
ncbi:MAG: CotH kinase family protein [Myxococcota bacterium]